MLIPREFSAAIMALALMAVASATVNANNCGSFVSNGKGRPQ